MPRLPNPRGVMGHQLGVVAERGETAVQAGGEVVLARCTPSGKGVGSGDLSGDVRDWYMLFGEYRLGPLTASACQDGGCRRPPTGSDPSWR